LYTNFSFSNPAFRVLDLFPSSGVRNAVRPVTALALSLYRTTEREREEKERKCGEVVRNTTLEGGDKKLYLRV
jgi:hypothetical protein